MSNSQITPASSRDLATMPLEQALDAYAPNFRDALPAHISTEHFKRMVVTAVNLQPDLVKADRRSFFNACVKCAHDGLILDGRDAALVVFNGIVAYLPMVAGIRKRMRNSGEILSATAEVVCKNDHFKYELGDNGYITHVPTALDAEPGDIIGAYAIIKLRSGEVLRDVMRKGDIEKSRSQGRAKNSLMWDKFYGEGCKKTVLRRCAKSAPQASELERLLGREEEIEQLEPAEPIPLRPVRADFVEVAGETLVEEEPIVYAVIDLDGVEQEYEAAADVQTRMLELIGEAEKRGPKALDGLMETNAGLCEFLKEQNERTVVGQIYSNANAAAKRLAAAPPTQTGAATSATAPAAGNGSGSPASGQQDGAGPTATAAASPSDAAGAPQASEAAQGAADTPKEEQGYQRPADAPAGTATQGVLATGEPLPPRNEWYAQETLAIEPRKKNGRPDWSTWVRAQFAPRVRGALINADMAKLLGDNEANLDQAKASSAELKTELEQLITVQWQKIPAAS